MITASRLPWAATWPRRPGLGGLPDGARGLALLWVISCLGLQLLGAWIGSGQGLGRVELDFWDAVRSLLLGAHRLGPSALVSIAPPPVLSLVLLAGSAANAASAIGAGGIATLALLLRRAGRSLGWLPLLVAQPAVLIAAAEYPSVLLRAILLLVVALALVAYLQRAATYYLLIAGLGLGGLAQVDQQSWPIWLYLAGLLLWARGTSAGERLAVLLVVLFPASFLSVARLYLLYIVGNDLSGTVSSSLDALAGSGAAMPALAGGFDDRISPEALLAAAYVLLALPFVIRAARFALADISAPEGAARRWLPVALLLASPLLDLLARAPVGRAWLPSLDAACLLIAALVASADPAGSEYRGGPGPDTPGNASAPDRRASPAS